MDYCNTTTDLTDVFPDVEKYQEKLTLRKEDFQSVSGQANTYAAYETGQVNMVFDAGDQLTAQTSVANVQSNAGSYYYDSGVDVLYVHANDSDDLTSAEPPIKIGEDWDALKEQLRDNACGVLDSYLKRKYVTPLAPRKVLHRDTEIWDPTIKTIAAYMTCAFIVRRRNPADPMGNSLYKIAWNANPEPGEDPGMVNLLLDGDLSLQDQITPGQPGKWEWIAIGSNTATRYPILRGEYEGSMYKHWRIEMDTAGAIGTATWKVSYDGGTTWDLTLQDTYDATDDERRFSIADGVYVEWPAQTYADGDYWDIALYPLDEIVGNPKVGSIELCRG